MVTATTAATSATAASAVGKAGPVQGSQEYFLQLLVAQLRNQDPLNPMDNAGMTSQIAQINTVQGIHDLNTSVASLISGLGNSQALQAAALVGHQVLAPGSILNLRDGSAVAGIELPQAVDGISVTIRDGSGVVVRTLELGPQAAGILPFQWNGKADNGSAAVNGDYQFSISATAAGQKVVANALTLGTVGSVTPSEQGALLDVNELGRFNFSQIRQIF